ncbi:MAG TPA: selenocysteine-specific translation elongation factor [Syntrophorhabdaceae bacterium]|nr:selenocysteine-specific translation elongation factor [Syntrophorhabdaceae bacterium]HPU29770.1 selenocysteine-specific translation elongation factor [Syntrophorhabdaceae bacterium]
MKRIVIGTAGHIDHGKTSLIKALTGIDCDRLKVEKERGITTELGFAHYKINDELIIGIVDVPGHEKFVKHMVSGSWGIDVVLLVIAADEGVMPQTREHMDICTMLGLEKAIVAITKKDLVDEEMLELVKEDIDDFLKLTPFKNAPVIPVSSHTGENLDILKKTIMDVALSTKERSKKGIFRLPVDRVFTLKGLGTIITGTCVSGHIEVGEEIEVYPLEKRARIRNIQAYHEDAKEAYAGQRVALNLQGIDRDEIERGTIIGRPNTLFPTKRLDVSFKYLKLPFKGIKTDSIFRFHLATMLDEARLILLDRDIIEPGDEAFAQLVFKEPIVALPGDRFIIRGSFRIQTIGGGVILDIAPLKHKRLSSELLDTYKILISGQPHEKALYHIKKGGHGGMEKDMLSTILGMEMDSMESVLNALKKDNKIKGMGKFIVDMDRFKEYKEMLKKNVMDFHEKNPLKVGISKEELRTRLPKVEQIIFQTSLDEFIKDGVLKIEQDKVIGIDKKDAADQHLDSIETEMLKILIKYGITPPGVKELSQEIKRDEKQTKDILERLVHKKKAVKVKSDLYFHTSIMDDLKETVERFLKEKREMTPSDFKSLFNVSRKYMIPILEYLDEIKLTIRVGDKRVLRSLNSH